MAEHIADTKLTERAIKRLADLRFVDAVESLSDLCEEEVAIMDSLCTALRFSRSEVARKSFAEGIKNITDAYHRLDYKLEEMKEILKD